MSDQKHSSEQAPPGSDQTDLSASSVSMSKADRAERPVSIVLREMQQSWLEQQHKNEQKGDLFGVQLSEKVQLLCEALHRIVNPVVLSSSQQAILQELILWEAGEGNYKKFFHPGYSTKIALPIAVYIHSLGS